jgi:hypothetical protein
MGEHGRLADAELREMIAGLVDDKFAGITRTAEFNVPALRSAFTELLELRAALTEIAYLRPFGPTRNKLVERMERIAVNALDPNNPKFNARKALETP